MPSAARELSSSPIYITNIPWQAFCHAPPTHSWYSVSDEQQHLTLSCVCCQTVDIHLPLSIPRLQDIHGLATYGLLTPPHLCGAVRPLYNITELQNLVDASGSLGKFLCLSIHIHGMVTPNHILIHLSLPWPIPTCTLRGSSHHCVLCTLCSCWLRFSLLLLSWQICSLLGKVLEVGMFRTLTVSW